jgi:hypothetical protein
MLTSKCAVILFVYLPEPFAVNNEIAARRVELAIFVHNWRAFELP